MPNPFREDELSETMTEVELLMKYRNFHEASRRLEGILAEHPSYLPAKEALQAVCRMTGQVKKSLDLQKEIRALSEQQVKRQLSATSLDEYAQTEKRLFTETVDRLIKIIYESGSLDEVFRKIAAELLEALKADRCIILLSVEDNEGSDAFERCSSDVPSCLNEEVKRFLLAWFTSQNLSLDTPILCRNAKADPSLVEYRQLLVEHQIHSMMAYPLIYKSRPLGWLVAQQCVPYYSWNESDLTLFSTVSGHLATAVHNLRSISAFREMATVDRLTGLHNRHYLQERMLVELSNAQRQKYPLSLAVLDIDHFKSINDTYGHQAGDEVLQKVGALLRSSLRKGCVIARWGGEEFLVILPQAQIEKAALIMERFRQQVSESIELEGRFVTISIGVAEVRFDRELSLEQIQAELIHGADTRLYEAKANGRNQVRWGSPAGPVKQDNPNIVELAQVEEPASGSTDRIASDLSINPPQEISPKLV